MYRSYVTLNQLKPTDPVSVIIAELAERSPISIQNSSSPSSRKNLDVRPYDRMTVQGATFNMHGQLYRGQVNVTALFSSPVVSALGSESDDRGSSPGRGKVLCPWDVREKKMRAPLLGLAKSIYYIDCHDFLFGVGCSVLFLIRKLFYFLVRTNSRRKSQFPL